MASISRRYSEHDARRHEIERLYPLLVLLIIVSLLLPIIPAEAQMGQDVVFTGTIENLDELGGCIHHKVKVTQVIQSPPGYPLKKDDLVFVVTCRGWPASVDKVNVGDLVEVLGPADPGLIFDLALTHHYLKKIDGGSQWFAIITDLHIGRYYGNSEYYELADNHGYNQEEYYLTNRLRAAVDEIIIQQPHPEFVVILGDISEHGDYNEFVKARDILKALNDNGIPYVPIMGNHDVPGEESFYEVFWQSPEGIYNRRLLGGVVDELDWDVGSGSFPSRTKILNLHFIYHGIDFIFLDFNEKNWSGGDTHDSTMEFLRKKLAAAKGQRQAIIFAHHPALNPDLFVFKGMLENFNRPSYQMIVDVIKDHKILAWYSGHIHSFDYIKPGGDIGDKFSNRIFYPDDTQAVTVVIVDALMRGSNVVWDNPVVRRVDILWANGIAYHNDKMFGIYKALNPSFSACVCSWVIPLYPPYEVEFKAYHHFTKREVAECKWDFEGDVGPQYGQTVRHTFRENKEYKVTLTVTDTVGITESITRTISPSALLYCGIIPTRIEVSAVLDAYSQNTPSELTGGNVPTKEDVFNYLDRYFKKQ